MFALRCLVVNCDCKQFDKMYMFLLFDQRQSDVSSSNDVRLLDSYKNFRHRIESELFLFLLLLMAILI